MATIDTPPPPGTPGDYFRALKAGAALQTLYEQEHCSYYAAVADKLSFVATASTFGLESLLDEQSGDGGYFIYIQRQEWAELLKQTPEQKPHRILPEAFTADPLWQGLIAFASQWHTGALCYKLMDGLWFEVDVSGPPPAVPVPSIFFGVQNLNAADAVSIILEGISTLTLDLPSQQKDLLATYLHRFSPLCSQFQVGLMLSRPAAPLRLCAFGGNLADMLAALTDLGIATLDNYPGFCQELPYLSPDFSAIDLDIGTTFGTKVGIELKFSRIPSIRAQQQAKPAYLQWLSDSGWCLPRRRQALQDWIGGHKFAANDFWQPRKMLLRTISHIKLDFKPSSQPRVKGYLEYNIR